MTNRYRTTRMKRKIGKPLEHKNLYTEIQGMMSKEWAEYGKNRKHIFHGQEFGISLEPLLPTPRACEPESNTAQIRPRPYQNTIRTKYSSSRSRVGGVTHRVTDIYKDKSRSVIEWCCKILSRNIKHLSDVIQLLLVAPIPETIRQI